MNLMFRRRGIAFRLSLLILTSSSLIFIAAFGYNYYHSRNLIIDNALEESRTLSRVAINRIETVLAGIDRPARLLSKTLESRDHSEAEVLKLIENLVEGTPEIFGSTAAFEPYGRDSRKRLFAPYYNKEKEKLKLTWLGENGYDYLQMDWYKIPKELGRASWSEPYFDEGGGNIVMCTFSAPFYKKTKDGNKFAGVVTADMSLDWLQDVISGISIYRNGYAFLISEKGTFITAPKRDIIMTQSIFSLAEKVGDPELRKACNDMISGGSGFVRLSGFYTGVKAWLYYAPLRSVKWSIGVVIPEDELFGSLHSLNMTVLIIGLAGIAFLSLVTVYLANSITRPLRLLAAATTEISKGSLDTPLPAAVSGDEVSRLIGSFENMRQSLKEYISNLKETTAIKERMESELKIARTIQMSFLPQVFPAFPDRREFDLYARLEPAREVGGDLYDFFLVDRDTLFFAIGDVSGKGVPAALLMAVTKRLLKAVTVTGMAPDEVLARVNLELCRDNDEMMFCTMICGMLDLRTGECRYSNAGHNEPVLVRAEGKAEWLKLPPGMIIGIDVNTVFETRKAVMSPGDTLLLYTDGVTEAENSLEELYSPERLLAAVESAAAKRPEELSAHILNSVQDFSGDTPQSDDITILAIQFKGPAGSEF